MSASAFFLITRSYTNLYIHIIMIILRVSFYFLVSLCMFFILRLILASCSAFSASHSYLWQALWMVASVSDVLLTLAKDLRLRQILSDFPLLLKPLNLCTDLTL